MAAVEKRENLEAKRQAEHVVCGGCASVCIEKSGSAASFAGEEKDGTGSDGIQCWVVAPLCAAHDTHQQSLMCLVGGRRDGQYGAEAGKAGG